MSNDNSEEDYISRQEWSLRQMLSFSITLPGFFLFYGSWLLCLMSMGLLVYLYYKHPFFIEYRAEGSWFFRYIKTMTVVNLTLGTIHYYLPDWRNAALTVWIIALLVGAALESRNLKSDKDCKGIFQK